MPDAWFHEGVTFSVGALADTSARVHVHWGALADTSARVHVHCHIRTARPTRTTPCG